MAGIKQIKTTFDLKRSADTVLRRKAQDIYLIMFLCVSFVLCVIVTSFLSNSKAGALLSSQTFQNNHHRSVQLLSYIVNTKIRYKKELNMIYQHLNKPKVTKYLMLRSYEANNA